MSKTTEGLRSNTNRWLVAKLTRPVDRDRDRIRDHGIHASATDEQRHDEEVAGERDEAVGDDEPKEREGRRPPPRVRRSPHVQRRCQTKLWTTAHRDGDGRRHAVPARARPRRAPTLS